MSKYLVSTSLNLANNKGNVKNVTLKSSKIAMNTLVRRSNSYFEHRRE